MLDKAVIYRPKSSSFKIEKLEELKEVLKHLGVDNIFVAEEVTEINPGMVNSNGVIFFLPCGCCTFMGRDVLGTLIEYDAPIVIGMPSNAESPIRLSGVLIDPTPQRLVDKALKLHYRRT